MKAYLLPYGYGQVPEVDEALRATAMTVGFSSDWRCIDFMVSSVDTVEFVRAMAFSWGVGRQGGVRS